jgi:amidase
MRTVSAQHCIYAFEAGMAPVCWIEPGDVVSLETRDALDRQVTPERHSLAGVDQDSVNPATGPVGVRGAKPGDTLAIDVLDIQVAPQGYVTFGGRPRFFQQTRDLVRFSEHVQLPTHPMIGTIGVAPTLGRVSNKLPGPHGGNMDVRDVRKGATLYLPISQQGAMFAIGDVHSIQADGESSGQGVETEAQITVRTRIVPGRLADWPVIYVDGDLMVVAAASTLDEAAALATSAMAGILTGWGYLDVAEARVLLGLIGDVRVGQMVCALRSVRVALPIGLIPWHVPLPL